MCKEQYAIRMNVNIIILVVLLALSKSEEDDYICPGDTYTGVFWPDTKSSSCAKSEPLCITEKLEIASRCCDIQGIWDDSPSCYYLQPKIENPCPDTVTQWSKSICIVVIENSTYPPQCPYEETLPFFDYIEAVDSRFLPVWMPVFRNTGRYGIGLLHWVEPASNYGTPYMSCGDDTCRNYRFSDSIIDKNCAVFYNTSHIEAVSCSERYTAVCAYRSLPDRTNSFCSQNFPSCMQSDYSTRSKCFCKNTVAQSTGFGAEFLRPYQNLIYHSLSNETCHIGLQKYFNDTYRWSNSNSTISYTNWAEDAIFGDDYIYGAISDDGWILTEAKDDASCDLYETDVPIKQSQISLEYDEDKGQFIVNLTNPTNWVYDQDQAVPMVFCFTDAVQNALVSKVEVTGSLMEDYALFSFQPHSDGPGTYWCEAFPYPNVTAMRSNEYLLRFTDSFTEEYVVLLKTRYVRGSNPLTEANMKSIRENLASQLDALQATTNFYPRIYKIVDVDEQNSRMTINFHVVNPDQSEPLTQYSVLRGYMEQNLTNFTFVNVLGVDRCVGIQTGNSPDTVTWPVTEINGVATKPREGYCIKSDGSIMYRKCNGNYIDGAQWEEMKEDCTIQQSTNITVNLTNIVDLNEPGEYIQQVADIVAYYCSDLVPLDVHLISIFLKQVAEADSEIDLNLSVKIVSELMDVPKRVLRKSQTLFNATDRILYYTDRIIENSKFIGDIVQENLMIISYYIKDGNLSGAIIRAADEIDSIYKIYNEFDLEKVMRIENLTAAVVISEELLLQLLETNQQNENDKSRLIITVYKNSKLFNEQGLELITTSIIIGALFPDLEETFSGKIFTIHNDLDDDFDDSFNCSYWRYELGEEKGFWQSEELTKYSKPSTVCSYDHLTHLAIAKKANVNVTLELENILASNISLPEKLESTSRLTKQYLSKFEPIDLMLLSLLFMEATTSSEDHLELVADILDKIIEIPPEVLRNSQILYNATGKILLYFEKLLEQSETPQLILRDHFYVIIRLLDEDNVHGFTLTNCNIYCNLTFLYEELENTISDVENLDTALLLDDALIRQLTDFTKENYIPKLVFTIFFNDALFIEDYNNIEVTTKVVGISMPGFDESLNGGIKLFYSVDLNMASNYSCSVYSNDDDASTAQKGFWNSEDPPKSVENILECQFWSPKYYALVHSLINFTSSLETMLESGEPVECILGKTDLILRNYHTYLKSVDVFIIAQLLSKVEVVDDQVLEVCLRIVSYAMHISRDILRESQEEYRATDLILYHINRIAASFDKDKVLHEDNIALVVSLLSETGVYGLGLENCENRCGVVLLDKENSTEVIQFDAALRINPNLINELLEDKSEIYIPKLVSIILNSDALFNEDDNRTTSIIFGVYFPNYNKSLPKEFKLYFHPSANASNYSCFNWYYQAVEDVDVVKGSWDYDSKARGDEMLSCNFYSSGYFTLIEGSHSYDNISDTLTRLLTSNVSFSEKLYIAEDTSYSYWDYVPVDVYLLSMIFSQCDDLDDNELERINIIVNNILRISKNILIESENDFNALTHLLRTVNEMASFSSPYQHSPIKDHFGLVICELNASTTIVGVTVTKSEVSCFTNITEETFASPERTIAGLALSKELLDQTISASEATKIVVMVLLDNIFFTEIERRNTSVILGISIPNLEEQLEGDIIALFSNHVYNSSSYDCAYWDSNSSASWNIEDDKTGIDSYTKCSFKQGSYLALVENSNVDDVALTQILKDIINGEYTTTEKLNQTESVITTYSDIFEAVHVFYVAEVLSHVEEVAIEDLRATAAIASNLTRVARLILVESQVMYNATDWILYHVDRIAEKFGGGATEVVTENLVVIITGSVAGIAIKNCNVSCNVVILQDGDSLDSQENLNTALLLDDDLQNQITTSSSVLIVTIYFNDALFNEGFNSTYKNVGQIIGVIIPTLELKMKGSLKFYYYTEVNSTEICAFWNYTVKQDQITRGHWERDNKPLQPSQILLCESKHATHFALLESQKNLTSDLENILNSNLTIREKLEEVVAITSSVPEKLAAVDIYLISQILDYALDEVGSQEMNLTSYIISRLFHVPRSVLRESQITYYATDRILHSVDEMAKLIDKTDSGPIVQEYFVVAVYDLKDTNISGMLLENCGTTKCTITTLENSVNLTELSLNEHLDTAVALSDELLYQIRHGDGAVKLVATIFFSDVLFNEENQRDDNISMVCGLLLPGLDDSLNGSIYLMYNTPDKVDYNNSCAFWNYNVNVVRGSWQSDAEPRSKEHFTICEFEHITHFALLLADSNSTFADANRYHILDIMTIVNCVLSIIGIFGILLTAALFERWRKNTGNQILVNFVIAISIKIVMLYVSVAVFSSKIADVGCCVTGAILHYAILSEFCWMLIIAILQFKRFVEVLGGPPKYILLKACICGWVFPILPVTLILLIDKDNYSEGQVGLCYPSGLGLYLGIWLPLIVIVAINFVIFIFIIYNVFHKKTESRDMVNHEILFQWRLALLLFSMLGLTWLFGFLGQINGMTIFVYLFCFTSTLQGFIMFLFFIVFNKSTRFLYAQAIKLWLYTKGYKVP